jgi:hypothetical protein
MKFNKVSRRMFLQGSGKTLLSIPFLTSLLPRETWGQSSNGIKRYIALLSQSEVGHNSLWLPSIGGSVTNLVQPNRTFDPGGGHHPIRWQPLSEFIPNTSTPLTPLYGTHLNSHLQHINILRGLDIMVRFGHGSGHILGSLNRADNIMGGLTQFQTIDTLMASNLLINPTRRLIFAGAEGPWEGYSLTAGGTLSTNIGYLDQLYNILFENGNFPENGSTTQNNHPKRDVLSRVLEDYNRLRNSRNISALDRAALTDATDKMSDVHRGLSNIVNSNQSCSHRNLNKTRFEIGMAASSENYSRILVDMITAAIMCDSNRVFTFGFWGPYEQFTGIIDPLFNYLGDWHNDISHAPFNVTNGRRNWEWIGHRQSFIISRLFAPLVRNLAAATDPSNGQSYLYNSLVHLSFESGQTHSHYSHPTILAGNAAGAISSGNYIDYSDRSKGAFSGADNFTNNPNEASFSNNYFGVNYNRLLVTILQAMGMTPAQYEVNSRNSQVYNRTDIGSQNANLTAIGGYGAAFNGDRTNTNVISIDNFHRLRNYDLNYFRSRLPML